MVILTRHAKNRMRRDKIDQVDVDDCIHSPDFARQCIHSPDFARQQDTGKIEAWKSYQGRYLKVVYREEGGGSIVITVTLKKKRPAWAAN